MEAKPAKGKRENKGGSVAQKGNRKGHAEAKEDQAKKSTGRMPRHRTPMKDVVSCEKLWGAASRH